MLSGNGSEEDKAEAGVEADVYESLQHALAKRYLDELSVVSEKVEALFLNIHDSTGRTRPEIGLLVVAEHNRARSFVRPREFVWRTFV